MATLSLTNTFIAGTLAKSSEVNQNFTDIINWSSGNIQNDNLGTMTGQITWSITTGVKAISIANSGNEGSISITQSSALNPNKASLRIIDNAAQTSGDAEVYISMTSLSSTIPALKVDYAGSQVFAVKRDRVELPARTKTERDNISSPADGSVLYVKSSPLDRYTGLQVKEANGWSQIMPPGVMVPYAGTNIPDGWLNCDGSEYSQTTYAALYAAIGSAWNTGGEAVGNFRVPDMRRRTAIGKGGTQIAGPGTSVGNVGGHEQLQSHNHSMNAAGTHSHGVTDPGHGHFVYCIGGGAFIGGIINATITTFTTATSASTVATTGISINADGSHSHSINNSGSGNAENMPPSAVVSYIIKF